MQEKSEEFLPDSSFTEVGETEKKALVRQPRSAEDFLSDDKRQPHNQIYLINKINYTNFQDIPILINFRHSVYNETTSFEVKPLPCSGNQLECYWLNEDDFDLLTTSYNFEAIFVPDGQSFLMAEPSLIEISREAVRFKLPEKCFEVSTRQVHRHRCTDVQVHLSQHGSIFKGKLINFNSVSLQLSFDVDPPQEFHWINQDDSVTIHLFTEQGAVFTGECRIIGYSEEYPTKALLVEPIHRKIRRFRAREFRSTRVKLNPPPNIYFRHPLSRKLISLKVIDLSGSGLSVDEDGNTPVLIPGMHIPKLEICFAMGMTVQCKAQVVYQEAFGVDEKEDRKTKCGIAILDMDPRDHAVLTSYLHNALDNHSYICNKVDIEALWEFFFETGFIYPEKYAFLEKHKEKIKETYEKLYNRSSNVARHFIYQKKGIILAHVAILRLYHNTWLVHHHASRKSLFNRGGLLVLKQIGDFGYDSHRLGSIHMRYLMCFYRNENKFPSRVFGGVAKSMNDLKKCSVDTFAYVHWQIGPDQNWNERNQWEISEAEDNDMKELELYYKHVSGGLILDALDLKTCSPSMTELISEFENAGLNRDRLLFTLKKRGIIYAIIMINTSDVGLNLSDLTNSITVFIFEPDALPYPVLKGALSEIRSNYNNDDIPVLIFPSYYPEKHNVSTEKKYNLWLLDINYSDHYFKFVNRLLKFF